MRMSWLITTRTRNRKTMRPRGKLSHQTPGRPSWKRWPTVDHTTVHSQPSRAKPSLTITYQIVTNIGIAREFNLLFWQRFSALFVNIIVTDIMNFKVVVCCYI